MFPISWWPTPLRIARLRAVVVAKAAGASLRLGARAPSSQRHAPEALRVLLERDRDERGARIARASAQGFTAAGAFMATLVERRWEGTESATLVFQREDAAPFVFQPGQFVTLSASPDGTPITRSYSLCSDPEESATFAITVRRKASGALSPWLIDGLAVGAALRFAGPTGGFGVRETQDCDAWWLVGAGAGATPLMACVHHLRRRVDGPPVQVVLQDRSPAEALFHPALEAIAEAHPSVRVQRHWTRAGGESARWTRAEDVLRHVTPAPRDRVLLCGPPAWMAMVQEALVQYGVPLDRIHTESFDVTLGEDGAVGAVHAVRLARSGKLLEVRDDQTILEAAREAGIGLPFSCGMGGCAACHQTLVSGQVAMREPNALSAQERAAGGILACIACPRSALTLDA